MITEIAKEHPEKMDTISGKLTENPVVSMDRLVIAMKLEVQSAEKWFDSLRNDEITWIKERKNPDDEFAAKYYNNPENQKLKQRVMENSNASEDNAIWLQLQLSRPQNIMNIHGYNKLNDSTRAVIDSIYALEFGEKEIENSESDREVKNKQGGKGNGSPFWLWALLLLPLMIGILYVKFSKRKK